MRKFDKNKWGLVVLMLLGISKTAFSQFSLSGQLRTRTEYRNGQGLPLSTTIHPAFFTSQRSRVGFAYTAYRLKTSIVLQDVRVWGQDASTNNGTSALNTMMIHEAFAEVSLLDTNQKLKELSIKIGRQELNYDDARLLGNLDWLQQARRHDLALLKFSSKKTLIHAGFAFNQNREQKSETIFNGVPASGVGTMYKSMQFVYAKKGSIAVLVLKDDFNKYVLDNQVKTLKRGVWSRITLGGNFAKSVHKMQFKAESYYQIGKDKNGSDIAAYLLSAQVLRQLNRQINIGIGYDYTSGNEANSKKNNAFDPLYGTPHKFWGLMDYFYVADGFGKSGLSDFYLRIKSKLNSKITASLDVHQFNTTNQLFENGIDGKPTQLSSNLGQEFDLVFQYNLTKNINFEGAYCFFKTTDTLNSSSVKNIKNSKDYADWAYLMLNLKF